MTKSMRPFLYSFHAVSEASSKYPDSMEAMSRTV